MGTRLRLSARLESHGRSVREFDSSIYRFLDHGTWMVCTRSSGLHVAITGGHDSLVGGLEDFGDRGENVGESEACRRAGSIIDHYFVF